MYPSKLFHLNDINISSRLLTLTKVGTCVENNACYYLIHYWCCWIDFRSIVVAFWVFMAVNSCKKSMCIWIVWFDANVMCFSESGIDFWLLALALTSPNFLVTAIILGFLCAHLQSPDWQPTLCVAWCLIWWFAKNIEQSTFKHDTDCLSWDQVSLNNTNSIKDLY